MGFFNDLMNTATKISSIINPLGLNPYLPNPIKYATEPGTGQITIPGVKIDDKGELTSITKKEEQKGNLQEIKEKEETPTIQEIWQREDEIRKETQEREDTAYQRAVEDMRKAGINPNIGSISAASSGGGITQASGMQSITTEMSGLVSQAIAEINNNVKVNENQKDRISDIISNLAQMILLKVLLKK